ncbi:MAG: S-methyl-5-thioribose-1-phosphate isomerase [Sarea resinae]|nr:MAG: S-methyl-5-thioribose-1-phosphate isomerase [Sarea resinae]
MTLEAIKYHRGSLSIINQLALPHTTVYAPIRSAQDAWHAIHSMLVRGAPAIAIVAALSLAVELEIIASRRSLSAVPEEVALFVEEKLDYLVTSRPTAVNMADAARKLKRVVASAKAEKDANGDAIKEAYIKAAEKMLVDDVHDNENIGKFGAEWILGHLPAGRSAGQISVLTHCNTGSLATAGHGTALGIIRTLYSTSHLSQAFFTETRPYNQGARLTAYELLHDGIPSTLITDSMAAALLRLRGSSDNIAAIVVGADRVARNGDTANKIGTYGLAILARQHGIRFIVAAPRTTIDLSTPSGAEIVIEERPGKEMTSVRGPRVVQGAKGAAAADPEDVLDLDVVETVRIAAPGVKVWNPSFDVTPAELIDAVVTEKGAVERGKDGVFDFSGIF